MTCCEFFLNLLIGLISGGVSSWIVSLILKKYWDKKQLEKDFEEERQMLSRYLSSIRQEILIGNKIGDYSFVLRELEDEPIRNSFQYLDERSSASMGEISQYLNELRAEFSKDEGMFQNHLKEISSKLYQYRLNVLKYEMKGR